MAIARAYAGAVLFCSLVSAVPAIAASRAERAGPGVAHSELMDRETSQAAGSEQIASDWTDALASKQIGTYGDSLAWTLSNLNVTDFHSSPVAFSPEPPRSNSAVPLPTGLSLFGAGLLTLGLVGAVSGAHRRPVVDTGILTDEDPLPAPAEATAPTRFKIEVKNDHGSQLRHTVSARSTIDLIADLLNEGWEIVAIRDRHGSPLDYHDILDAWHSERVDHRKHATRSS